MRRLRSRARTKLIPAAARSATSAMTSISVFELESVDAAAFVFALEIALLAFSTAVVRSSAAVLASLLASLAAAAVLWALASARTWLSSARQSFSLPFSALIAFLAAGVVA